MSEPTSREEIEKNSEMFETVMSVANSQYTGTWRKTLSDGKLYNQAAVNAEVLAVLDRLEKEAVENVAGAKVVGLWAITQLKQRYGGKEQK